MENRRNFGKNSVLLTAGVPFAGVNSACKDTTKSEAAVKPLVFQKENIEWPIKKEVDIPKISVGVSGDIDKSTMRKIKQLGVNHVSMGGPHIPWTKKKLKSIIDAYGKEGLNVINMMIGGFPNVIYGKNERHEEIKLIKQSIIAAGKVALPIVEYNYLC